jgi:hypothetical protein
MEKKAKAEAKRNRRGKQKQGGDAKNPPDVELTQPEAAN